MNNELYHYGVKGMKWGIRRYRNADGSLTKAGKKRQSKEIYTKIKQNSGHDKRFTDLRNPIEKDVKSHEAFKQHKKTAKETWRKYLDESERMDNDYDKTIRKIHKDPEFKKAVAKLEKDVLSEYEKGTRGYEKNMMYGIDSLEGEHPLYKEHRKRAKAYEKLRDEAYESSKKVADEILGKYGNRPVKNMNVWDAKARDIVSSVIRDDIMGDYYNEKYSK